MATFTNRERALRRLRAIPDEILERIKAQLRANAQDLVIAQRAAAPREEGDLAESIRWEDHTDEKRIRVKVRAGGEKTTRPVRAGQSATYDYALAQEFGTEEMPAHPFFFPTYRGRKRRYAAQLRAAAKAGVSAAIRKP